MAGSAKKLFSASDCRRTVLLWAASSVAIAVLQFGWLGLIGFPIPHEWASDLPLMPVSLVLFLLNAPGVVAMAALGSLSDSLGWGEGVAVVAINIGVYALLGGYACRLKRSADANRHT